MNFLPTAAMPCPDCNGTRYNPATLDIRYKGKNIADILAMPIEEARDFFTAHAALHRTLSLLCDTGLGYLTLGQSSPTLSGGEAQRLKLVTELSRSDTGETLYLLEEPSIGLHGHDVARLLDLLHRLVDAGHTVIVIEHHLDIIAEADWLIELGPGGGDRGGQLLHCGPPEDILRVKNSPTAPFLKKILTTPKRKR
jgi:excinuclease ABC subunit A